MLEQSVSFSQDSRQALLFTPSRGEPISIPVHALPTPSSFHSKFRLTTTYEEAPGRSLGLSQPLLRKLQNIDVVPYSMWEHTGCWRHSLLQISSVVTFLTSSRPVSGHVASERYSFQDNDPAVNRVNDVGKWNWPMHSMHIHRFANLGHLPAWKSCETRRARNIAFREES